MPEGYCCNCALGFQWRKKQEFTKPFQLMTENTVDISNVSKYFIFEVMDEDMRKIIPR
jgi:hypothetical protein